MVKEEVKKEQGFKKFPSRTRRTPFRKREEKPKEFESKLLGLARVSHTRAGGRRIGFRAIMVLGNMAGKIGIGVAKGTDVALAIDKASKLAKKNMIEIPIISDTIPHEVEAKFNSAKVLLKPQIKGRGLVAGGTIRIICNLVGIKNISSKMLGRTRNKLNNAKATILALKKLKMKKHATTRTKTKTQEKA